MDDRKKERWANILISESLNVKVLKITLMMRQSERGRVTTTRKMEAKMRRWVHTFD